MCFFYGWTHDQLMSLSIDELNNYWQAITSIEAQELLKKLTVVDWPNMKKSQREKLHRQLYGDAYPATFKETRKVSNLDLARVLGG